MSITHTKHSSLSLQWRLTLMAAAVTALACLCLTILLGFSANKKMNEIGDFLVQIDNAELPEDAVIEKIEVIPDYENQLQTKKQSFRFESFAAMLGIILASSVLTYFITGHTLRHLKKLTACMEQTQAQNLSAPVELESEKLPAELARLYHTFADMLLRLEHSFSTQKQFSANVAHELRTPLAVMQAKVEVFQKNAAHNPDEFEPVLDSLAQQIERLSHIVNELLELTTLETAALTDSICLPPLMEEIMCDLQSLASDRGVTLVLDDSCTYDDTVSIPVIMGNETLIYRAIFNLAENAIKYNRPDGTVTMSLNKTASGVSICITDTGIGIPKDDWETIFDAFYRVDKSRSRTLGGAGIGLAMVRTIANLHGGKAYVKNSSSEGSCIVFEL
ncbi:HAMP domain-containing histidine kinase [Eisenbergiella tayi]|uniref:histidine kinase n=1 Tax=Eisenbergiella porci TaxID=2652274 RepID=A0A6N7WRK1_9FIRM|nr:HAMP domain-containing sensor histidine kinase [Eisenbergiella porci]MSS92108.1 HAMP domain-containing histidine kinase [Eisenbergiella porci]